MVVCSANRALPMVHITHIFLLDFNERAGKLVMAVYPAKRAQAFMRASSLVVSVLATNRALAVLRAERQSRTENTRDSNLRSSWGILTRCLTRMRASALVVSTFKADRASHLCNRTHFPIG